MTPDFPSKCLAGEIETLLDALYEAKRELEVEIPCAVDKEAHAHPHFVLIARGGECRSEFENRIFSYLATKHGFDMNKRPTYDLHPLKRSSTFCFPNGVTVSVISL